MMKALLLVILRAALLLCTELAVKEGPASYTTTLDSFEGIADVVNHVPRHERDGKIFNEHTKIENMDLGVSVWRESGEDFCYFRHMMEYETPPLLMDIAKNLEKRKTVISAANITKVILWAEPDRELTDVERNSLSVAMQVLCAGIPIIKMNTEPVTKEEFNKRVENNYECFYTQTGLHGRKKRSPAPVRDHTTCDFCANGCPCYPNRCPEALTKPGTRSKRQTCSGRKKRSLEGSADDGLRHLVHLVIGHIGINCV